MGAGVNFKFYCNDCEGEFGAPVSSEEEAEKLFCVFCGGRSLNYVYKESSGIKHDQDKPMMALLPFDALYEVSKVFTFGAKKYAPHNWRKGFEWSRLASASLRHFTAWINGEDRDPETGELHLAHWVATGLMLLAHQLKGYGEDDRYDSNTNT